MMLRKKHQKGIIGSRHGHTAILFLFLAVWVVIPSNARVAGAAEVVTVSGLTEPLHDIELSFEVDGKISKIFFKEGAFVEKGATLMVLNKWLEELDVKRNRLIWESKVEVESAGERVKTLKGMYQSTLELYKKTGSVSKDEVQKLELEYKLAQAEHSRLVIAEEREKIEYDMARAKLSKLILKTPITGIVSELFLDEGESCESRQAVVRVVNTSRCLLVCNIDASLNIGMKEGQLVDLRIPVGSGSLEKKGKITFISPVVDPASGLYQVKAEFANKDRSIKPGVEGFMQLAESGDDQ